MQTQIFLAKQAITGLKKELNEAKDHEKKKKVIITNISHNLVSKKSGKTEVPQSSKKKFYLTL